MTRQKENANPQNQSMPILQVSHNQKVQENHLVEIKGNKVVTTSLQIAQVFDKRHDNVLRDIEEIYASGNKSLIKKLETILQELIENPQLGTGKVERLKYYNTYFSRRLNHEHRLVYSVHAKEIKVYIISAKGHYNNLK